ncbi:unnamed protein product [Moneuplotes crassus]|uniref:Uncharacterized protein n=1 Tax=Euplotes crassus TaxID=5936 RepID=A0AAD2D048_EUPCR|nr:unnamed protein product [Moneuplotes crassus]
MYIPGTPPVSIFKKTNLVPFSKDSWFNCIGNSLCNQQLLSEDHCNRSLTLIHDLSGKFWKSVMYKTLNTHTKRITLTGLKLSTRDIEIIICGRGMSKVSFDCCIIPTQKDSYKTLHNKVCQKRLNPLFGGVEVLRTIKSN